MNGIGGNFAPNIFGIEYPHISASRIPTFFPCFAKAIPSKDEIVDRVKDSLEEVGLDGKENHFPSELSGGEQQRACVARAMIKEPDVILADEPTGNLDPVTSFELIKFFEEINREGTAILMASHNYNLIKGRGHRIIEIRNGSIRRS